MAEQILVHYNYLTMVNNEPYNKTVKVLWLTIVNPGPAEPRYALSLGTV